MPSSNLPSAKRASTKYGQSHVAEFIELGRAETYDADADFASESEWALTIHGEGEQSEVITGDAEAAEAKADELISAGDYGLAKGESVVVQYHLTSTRGERVDSQVTVTR